MITVKVKELTIETEDAVTFTLDTILDYQPGQFITVILNINGEEYRRSYSLSSSPVTEIFPAFTVKKIAKGIVSNYLVDQIQVGDNLVILPPAGRFHLNPTSVKTHNVVLVAGGSGITPLLSIAKTILHQNQESKVYLIYAVKNENSIILYQQLENLKIIYENRFVVKYHFSQPLHYTVPPSRLNTSLLIKIFNDVSKMFNYSESEVYVCGPSGLMQSIFTALAILKIPKSSIFQEYFQPAQTITKVIVENPVQISEDTMLLSEVTIKYKGDHHIVIVPTSQTILQTALDNNIKLPYSCQSGMCTACMGKCIEGEIKQMDPDGLSENEIKKGFILTCVSYPKSSKVSIEID